MGIPSSLPATRPPVFSMADEDELVRRIKDLESQGFGIRVQAVCKLAYKMAEHAGINTDSVISGRVHDMIGTSVLWNVILTCC